MATKRNGSRGGSSNRVLMIGAAGGVGTATLALLERHALGRRILEGTGELLLLDRDPGPPPALPARLAAKSRWLPPRTIGGREDLDALLDEHSVDEVIELAALGTWDCVEACSERGCSYLDTCYDHWDAAPSVAAMLRARELFEPPEIEAGVHVIGSGMNPGLVNMLVAAGLDALAERSRRRPSLAALDIHTIAFTEIDTTIDTSEREALDEFASTWRPEHCLEELLEPSAMLVADGELVTLDHAPHRARYEARCGDRTIVGAMVPHEELVTLAAMYPGVELGYVYALPDAAWQALARHPDRRAEDWAVRRLYPPFVSTLSGFDRIGVLLCSRTLGELWIGWHTEVADALALGTNATLLQVATGLVCGWTALRTSEPGVWLPEELEGRSLLRSACSILGELDIVWDPAAPVRSLRERRVD